MAALLRGDIRWADLDPVRGHEQGGLRPVLILSQDVFNRHSGTAIILAITSQEPRAGFPLTLKLPDGLLPRPSWIKIGQVRTLSTERIGKKIAGLDPDTLERIVSGLNEIVGE